MSIINYIKDSFSELKNNVTWSSWSEVQRLTIIVAIFSILLSLAIWGADELLIKVIEAFYSLING
ncbi:MAG: preprotein translocase subunit SecE [Flavobacteriaceae bacterium]